MENNLITFNDMSLMAKAIGASKLFGQSNEQCLALMLVAQAEGRHPAIVARDYHVIQGRPSLRADAMMARFQESGGKVVWHSLTDTLSEATFSHPQGGEVKLSWSIEMAKRAGLLSKPGPWQQYPRAMLRARLLSEGIRTIWPSVVCGVYTPEEVQDFSAPPVKSMGAAERIEITEEEKREYIMSMSRSRSMEDLKDAYTYAYRSGIASQDLNFLEEIARLKEENKSRLLTEKEEVSTDVPIIEEELP